MDDCQSHLPCGDGERSSPHYCAIIMQGTTAFNMIVLIASPFISTLDYVLGVRISCLKIEKKNFFFFNCIFEKVVLKN